MDPETYITIAMDGSDQLSNGVPQFREISKDDCGQSRIKNHLATVQIAGSPDIVKCYVVPEDIAPDSNVSVEVLQRTLKAEEKRRQRLPDILHLQLDNCAGSNKNTYLFAYLAWLVERGVFKAVYVSFLPVGHTHNGPDRISSRISNAVRRTNIYTYKRFFELIAGQHVFTLFVISFHPFIRFFLPAIQAATHLALTWSSSIALPVLRSS